MSHWNATYRCACQGVVGVRASMAGIRLGGAANPVFAKP